MCDIVEVCLWEYEGMCVVNGRCDLWVYVCGVMCVREAVGLLVRGV